MECNFTISIREVKWYQQINIQITIREQTKNKSFTWEKISYQLPYLHKASCYAFQMFWRLNIDCIYRRSINNSTKLNGKNKKLRVRTISWGYLLKSQYNPHWFCKLKRLPACLSLFSFFPVVVISISFRVPPGPRARDRKKLGHRNSSLISSSITRIVETVSTTCNIAW